MWWCCGKPGKEAPGCKYSKHVSKEDEDDLEELELRDLYNKSKKNGCMVMI